MSSIPPTPAPNVENELAKLANDAIAAGADPGDVSAKLRTVVMHLRANPDLMAHVTNALADGVATPADISRKVFEHAQSAPAPAPAAPAAPQGDSQEGPLTRFGHRVEAHAANVLTALPGSEALMAGLYGEINHEPYAQARNDIEKLKQTVPRGARIAETIAGSAPLAFVPGSPALVGAGSAAADQLANSDPNVGVKARLARAAIAAELGYETGALTDAAVTRLRAAAAPTLGAQRVESEAALAKRDADLFGRAKAEGRAVPNPPITPKQQAVLDDPIASEYVAMAGTNPKNAGAPPSDVLMHAYRFMSRQQSSVLDKIAQKGEYDAILEDLADRLAASKQKVRDAITEIAPTFPEANAAHAAARGEQRVAEQASDVADRVLSARRISGKKIKTQAPEIFDRNLNAPNAVTGAPSGATLGERQAATQAVLGRLKEYPKFASGRIPFTNVNFPFPFPSAAALRAPGLVRMVGGAQQPLYDFLAKLGVVGTTGVLSPQ